MMNFKTLIISTSLSVFFGIYSIYGLIVYLEKLEKLDELETSDKYCKTEIDCLKKTIVDINQKYDETNKKYNDLLVNFQKINIDIGILSNNITNLDTGKIEINNCVNYESSLEDIMEDSIDNYKIICDAIIDIPDMHRELLNLLHNNEPTKEHVNDINKESNFEEHEFEILEQGYLNNEHIVKSRARGTSISEINWTEATKKFIFG
jgi:peptidoglycan hydrolase CwlO-like protein